MSATNPLLPFLDRQGLVILDGGLATALEERGHNIDHPLWSARLLMESPGVIRELHGDYLRAGADCVTTSSYQATVTGFVRQGTDHAGAISLLQRSSTLAIEARDNFWRDETNRTGRERPLVAASIGPYGAFLADGSEYTGRYELGEDDLFAFHRERWQILAATGVDLLACETIPSMTETRVIRRLMNETPNLWAWVSFSCRDEAHLHDGTPIVEAAAVLSSATNLAAVGINCTPPEHIEPLAGLLLAGQLHPVIVYPNSGESYDAATKTWTVTKRNARLLPMARRWAARGVAGIGGCCRLGIDDIAALRTALIGPAPLANGRNLFEQEA